MSKFHIVSAIDGSTGIHHALRAAKPGETVSILAGTYKLQGTLRIPDGVTLAGAGREETILTHDFDGPAIEARNVSDICLRDCSIHSTTKSVTFRIMPEDDPIPEDQIGDQYLHWGLLFLDRCTGARAVNLGLSSTGHGSRLPGIAAEICSDVLLQGLHVNGFDGSGISLFGSVEAVVEHCHCSKTGETGIVLWRSRFIPDQPSSAVLRENICHENNGSGIALASSTSEDIRGNTCWGNGINGIALYRDPRSLDQPSSAVLRENICHENNGSGIALASSTSEDIRGNTCWGNGNNGIALYRDPGSLDQPSIAVLRENICHENNGSGIALASSTSEDIRGNTCWGNGYTGIALYRDPGSLDQPSSAVLYDNICHENNDSGIVLASSTSEDIRGNTCWGNGNNGIALYRDPGSLDQPSSAVLRENICHENNTSGIGLGSSTSEDIRGNTCWGNGKTGILVQRQDNSPDQPSSAVLYDNICFENNDGFVVDTSSTVTQSGNILFRNNRNATATDPQGDVMGWLDWDFETPRHSDEAVDKIRRDQHPAGNLANRLQAKSIARPDAMAQFLFGKGALGGLKRWLELEPAQLTDTNAEVSLDGGTFRLSPQVGLHTDGSQIIRFLKARASGIRGAVWDCAANHILNRKPGVHVIGAFGDQGAEIDKLISEFDAINGFHIEATDNAADIPSRRMDLVRNLPISGLTTGRPLVYDCSQRSEAVLAKKPVGLPFLEPQRQEGPDLILSWVRFVIGSRRLMSKIVGFLALACVTAVLVGAWKGFADPWMNPLGAAGFALRSTIEDFQLNDILAWLLVPSAGLTGLIAWLNKGVPSHLFLKFRESDPIPRAERLRPWTEWVRRRVFGSGSINLVVLRDLQEWHDDDRAAFGEMLSFCPKDKSLIVVIEAPTRAILDRSLLRAFGECDSQLNIPDGISVSACLGPEPELLSLDDIEQNIDIVPLVGLGKSDPARIERIKASILSPDFTVSDLLPMLSIGSTYMGSFELSRRADESYSRFGPDFEAVFRKFGSIFEDQDNFASDLQYEVERLNDWIQEADDASACVLLKQTQNRITRYHVMGRYQRRKAMIAALASDEDLFSKNRDELSDYVYGMMICGLIGALDRVEQLLKPEAGIPPAVNGAFSALYSALILRREMEGMGFQPTESRRCIVDAAWERALATIDSVDPPKSADTIAAAKIYALSCQTRSEPLNVSGESAAGLGNSFLAEINHCKSLFERFDKTVARTRAELRLLPMFRLLPERDRAVLASQLDRFEAGGQHLAQLFADCTTAVQILDVFKRHVQCGDKNALATLLAHVTRELENEDDRVALAKILSGKNNALSDITLDAKSRGYARAQHLGTAELITAVEKSLDCLEGSSSKNDQGEKQSFPHFELMYGNLESLEVSSRQLIRVELAENLPSSMTNYADYQVNYVQSDLPMPEGE